MKPTDIAAWWGAGIATTVLLWDFIKWKKQGPRIYFKAKMGMVVVGVGEDPEQKFCTARVKNRGNQSTTIENMGFAFYKTWFHHFFRKADKYFVISQAGFPMPIPHVLEPGGIWDGRALQDGELEKMATEGYLECQIFCSHCEKPFVARVRWKKPI